MVNVYLKWICFPAHNDVKNRFYYAPYLDTKARLQRSRSSEWIGSHPCSWMRRKLRKVRRRRDGRNAARYVLLVIVWMISIVKIYWPMPTPNTAQYINLRLSHCFVCILLSCSPENRETPARRIGPHSRSTWRSRPSSLGTRLDPSTCTSQRWDEYYTTLQLQEAGDRTDETTVSRQRASEPCCSNRKPRILSQRSHAEGLCGTRRRTVLDAQWFGRNVRIWSSSAYHWCCIYELISSSQCHDRMNSEQNKSFHPASIHRG